MASLFQYAVLFHPTSEEREMGKRSEIVVPPGKWILADSEQEVVMIAGRSIPEDKMANADRLEVAVRPF